MECRRVGSDASRRRGRRVGWRRGRVIRFAVIAWRAAVMNFVLTVRLEDRSGRPFADEKNVASR